MTDAPLKLCMISGSFEYDSEASLKIFHDYVEREHPVKATLIAYQTEDDHRSLEPLDDTDVLLGFTRRLNTAGEELRQFIEQFEQLEAEKKDIAERQKEVMAEAKARGSRKFARFAKGGPFAKCISE